MGNDRERLDREQMWQHLGLIQTVIERHARTSFLLKGWTVTLATAVFLLAVRSEIPGASLVVGLLPALAFWGLDAYYLRQERLFRKLYDHVRTSPGTSDPFTMNTAPFAGTVQSWRRTLVSFSVFWFHAPVIVALVVGLGLFLCLGAKLPMPDGAAPPAAASDRPEP